MKYLPKKKYQTEKVKFRATIRSQNRITIPNKLVDFNEGDKVIVIVKKEEIHV